MYDCEMVRDGGGQARFAGLRLIGLGASENRQRSEMEGTLDGNRERVWNVSEIKCRGKDVGWKRLEGWESC
jgi:hypothetical protein